MLGGYIYIVDLRTRVAHQDGTKMCCDVKLNVNDPSAATVRTENFKSFGPYLRGGRVHAARSSGCWRRAPAWKRMMRRPLCAG